MRKKIKRGLVFLAIGCIVWGMAACAAPDGQENGGADAATKGESQGNTAKEEKKAKSGSMAVSDAVEVDAELPQEGEITEAEGYSTMVDWFEYGGRKIFGRFYYPEGYEESQMYTTVLLCHGGNSTADFWDKVYAPRLARQGYICYAIDCRGGTGDHNSERVTYSTPAPDPAANIMTYAEDLTAAVDFVKQKSYVDKNSLYLMGGSQGGMTSQIAASRRAEDIAGVVVLYGSVMDKYKEDIENFEELEANPYNNGEVLFIQGTEETLRTEQDTVNNMGWYDAASFLLIREAYHGFGNQEDRPSLMSIEEVVNFIERTKTERAEGAYSDYASTEEQRAQTEEGATWKGDGFSVSVNWIASEKGKIFGRFYYPEGFEETQEYPTVLLCHGSSITSDIWDTVYAPLLAREGYVCYALDCRSGTGDKNTARVTYSDPAPGGTATVETYTEDVMAAMDFVKEKPFVNTEEFYLCGQSMGGMTVQNVAAQRAEEVAGVIILYGSVSEDNKDRISTYDTLKESPYDKGEVLFIQGTEDTLISVERTVENMDWYADSALMLINEAYHGFGNSPSRPAEICAESMIDFLDRTSRRTGETAR